MQDTRNRSAGEQATPHGASARRVPEVTVNRLSVYLRLLIALEAEGRETVSSADLAARSPYSAAQIRRDLAWFGQFGTRGKGYPIRTLLKTLRSILGVLRPRRVVVVGAGNLGSALLGYAGFRSHNFHLIAAFDIDPRKVGQTIHGVPVYEMDRLPEVVSREEAEIAILAVPPAAAQEALERVAAAGIRAVLNFAPASLNPPPGVRLRNVDLATELEVLSYYLTNEPFPAEPSPTPRPSESVLR